MLQAGSGLGSCGFLVFDDTTDFVAVAHGVSRFLAVESCGQCRPCKEDGKGIAEGLDRLRRSQPEADELETILLRLDTVTDGARCYLAQQHQNLVRSLVAAFHGQFRTHEDPSTPAADEVPIAAIRSLDGDQIVVDDDQLRKQPDWTYDDVDSGASPSDRINERAKADGTD
jgi:hypothetical protein